MKEKIQNFIKKVLEVNQVDIEVPTATSHGHYSTNVAMILAKGSPVKLASEYVEALLKGDKEKMFSRIEVAGPGFINFTLSSEYLYGELALFSKKRKVTAPDIGKGKLAIIEYSSPNIAKPMHVGHMRSTIIGDSINRIHKYLGYKTIRWNYVGDTGTQFGKLIAAYKLWGDKEKIEADPVNELVELYIRFHKELENNPELEDEGRREFAKLEKKDKTNLALWSWFSKVSLKEFKDIYKLLGVEFDIYKGESRFSGSQLQKFIKKLKAQKIAVSSQGALIINLDEFSLPPVLIRKADGSTIYFSRDLFLLKHRLKNYNPKKILIETGGEQALHFQQLQAVAKILGLDSAELTHIKHGLVLDKSGKKLSTREGGAVRLIDLVTKVLDEANKVVLEKNPEMDEEQRREIAKVVGIGALKYADLKENRNSDMVFDLDQMLSFSGNSGPYLQYSYARYMSIIEKVGELSGAKIEALVLEKEISIIKKIMDFTDVVLLCEKTYLTSYLASYLHELAKETNSYYENTRILDDEDDRRMKARALLLLQVSRVLEKGLDLMGVEVLKRI